MDFIKRREIVTVLQRYIDRYGIKQYVEPFSGKFDIIQRIKCDYRLGNDVDAKLCRKAEKKTNGVLVGCADYRDLILPKNEKVLIFCDPPKIDRKTQEEFDAAEFWAWVLDRAAEGHYVFTLTETAPRGFYVVWNATTKKDKKLYIYGGTLW